MATKILCSFRLSEVVADRLNELAEQQGVKKTDLIEKMIMGYDSKSPSFSEGIGLSAEQFETLIKKINALDRNSFHELNILNSMLHNLGFDIYENAKENPHEILLKSKKDFENSLIRSRSKI